MRLFFLIFLSFIGLAAWAQPSQAPVRFLDDQARLYRQTELYRSYHKGQTRQMVAASDEPITAPFFDDFSDTTISPSLKRWVYNSGVYVGDRFAYHPPSKGVATLDGIKANGLPYSDNSTAQGPCDTLMTHPIRMDLFSAPQRPNVYLSFYLQAGNPIVEFRPDAVDSLVLQFNSNPDSNWHTVAKYVGGQDTTDFRYHLIPISSEYFTDQFRFRFINFGRQNGAYDTWNLDYIYLDERNLKPDLTVDSTYTDIALSGPLPGYFGRYRAIPLDHYNNNQVRTADSVTARAVNLNNTTIVFDQEFRADSLVGDPQQYPILTAQLTAGLFVQQKQTRDLHVDGANLAGSRNLRAYSRFLYRLALTNVDQNFNAITGNDTIADTAILADYYAADDNSAEVVHTVTGNSAWLLVKVFPAAAGILTGVEIDIDERSFNSDSTNSPEILIYVYKTLNGVDGTTGRPAAKVQAFIIPSGSSGIQRFMFDNDPVPISLTDEPYYIGYRQSANPNQQIYIRSDINSGQSDIRVNYAGSFDTTSLLKGTPIIRPFYQCVLCPVATKPLLGRDALQMSPNPVEAGGTLRLGGAYTQAWLTAADGRRTLILPKVEGRKSTLEVPPSLPPGLYAIEAWPVAGVPAAGRVVIR